MIASALISDLDRTLIHPLHSLDPAAGEQAQIVEHYEGRAITVAHKECLRDLALLAGAGRFVPATTRSEAQLKRITPIWALCRRRWAICANGATVLVNGLPDGDWAAQVHARARGAARADEVRQTLDRCLGPPAEDRWLQRWRTCDDHFLYAVCAVDTMPAGVAESVSAPLLELGWRAVLHGRKLYVLPVDLTKGAAARHVADRLGIKRVLSAGDSALDIDLIALGDRAWVPADAEIAGAGGAVARALMPGARHIEAGRRIAAQALAETRAGVVG